MLLAHAPPAAAQTAGTLTIAAVNDNGDRDATAPGLQVDEGDTVTVTITAHGKTAGLVNVNALPTGSATSSASNQPPADVHNTRGASPGGRITGAVFSGTTTDTVDLSITADNMAEGDETITFTLDGSSVAAAGATPASWTVGAPNSVTFTIRRNDASNRYAPAPVTPAPTADNPAARAARVKAPAAAIARGIGQLAADAVARRVGGDGDGGGRVGLWTGGGGISTDGERDNIAYDGDTSALHIGVDRRWRGGRIGFSVAQSGADMDFGADNLDADVTSVHPYLSRAFGDKRFWLTVGHGSGDAELTEGNAAPIKTDLSITTAALGLSIAPRDGVELSAAAVHTRAKLDAASAGARALPSTTADATRLSAAAELSRELATGARPFLTVKVRHDSGDDEQGTAGDLGGGVEWETPTVFFRLEGVAHVGGDGGEEQRFGLTVRKTIGQVNIGLNLGLTDGVHTADLFSGEWRF